MRNLFASLRLPALTPYIVAGALILIAAAGLRFYGLTAEGLSYDEARAANNTRGALGDVLPNTRYENSSPILYPLALWAIQKVDSSPFSVRAAPAAASVLTVAAILFLLPRVGMSRRAALIAAILAASSIPAIENAKDAREYSIDALAAALTIFALLRYLKGGGNKPLSAALFVGPLLQYGLVLFGAATIATAFLHPQPPAAAHPPRGALGWLRRRTPLIPPIACFAAGCAVSYALTVRHHRDIFGSGHYLSELFYQGAYGDAGAILQFSASGIWRLLTYHMPESVAAAALSCAALVLSASIYRRRLDAIALLTLLAVGIALFAGIVRFYPFGGGRQTLYLGPALFLAAGFAFSRTADELASVARWARPRLVEIARRAWREVARRPWLAISSLIIIAGAGYASAAELAHYDGDTRFILTRNIDDVLALVDERARPDDLVYTSRYFSPTAMFYHKEERDNYHYGEKICEPSLSSGCFPEMLAAFAAAESANRIWLVHKGWETLPGELERPIFATERIVGEGDARLLLIANGGVALALLANGEDADDDVETRMMKRWKRLVPDEPIIRSYFNVYRTDGVEGIDALIYAREPCAESDARGRFLLSATPVHRSDVEEHMRDKGLSHNSLNFDFADYGGIFGGTCVILRFLPEYPIAGIETGQWIPDEGVGAWNAKAASGD